MLSFELFNSKERKEKKVRLIGLFDGVGLSLSGIIVYDEKKLLGKRKSPISLPKILGGNKSNPWWKQAISLAETSEFLAERGKGLWHLTSKALPSSCNEGDKCDFDFIRLKCTIAV